MTTFKHLEKEPVIKDSESLMSHVYANKDIFAKKFREYTIEALDKAKEILLGSKDSDYNSAWIEMLDYFLPFPSIF